MNFEDQRNFRRYRTHVECEIVVEGQKTLKGKVFDYSDGVGAVTEHVSHLIPGTQVDIKIPDLDTEFRGEVAWTGSVRNCLRVGFKRIDHFQGSLRNYKLPDLLIGIDRSTKTGVLEIKNGSIVKKVFFKNGDIIFSTSTKKDDRLGEMLLKEGKITLHDFDKASTIVVKTGHKLGKILVELGLLTPSELFKSLNHQVEEIIMSLFTIEEGHYEFREEPLSAEGLVTLKISTANIIYKGMKRVNDFVYIKAMCPPNNAVLTLSQNPLNIFQSLTPEQSDKDILYHVSKKNSLKKILDLSPLNNFETLRTVSALLSTRFITIMREEGDSIELSIDEILSEIDENKPEEFMGAIEDMFTRCEALGYYDILGVHEDTAQDDIKTAYFRLSKQYHPDRHFSFPAYDMKGKLITIFSYLTEAYETLTDPDRRAEYNRKFSIEEMNPEMKLGEETNEAVPGPVEHGETVEAAVGPENMYNDGAVVAELPEYHAVESDLTGPVISENEEAADNFQEGSRKALLASPGETLYIGPRKNYNFLIYAMLVLLVLGFSTVTFLYSDAQKKLYVNASLTHAQSAPPVVSKKTTTLPPLRNDAFKKILQQ